MLLLNLIQCQNRRKNPDNPQWNCAEKYLLAIEQCIRTSKRELAEPISTCQKQRSKQYILEYTKM